MPAVTVDNILTVPVVPSQDAEHNVPRPVRSITTAPNGLEGDGFPVRRGFAGPELGVRGSTYPLYVVVRR